MLNKTDKEVMRYIYLKSYKKGTSLISPQELISNIGGGLVISPAEMNTSLNNLQMDGYIECILTDTKGKQMYCFNLKQKGEAFLRELDNQKKSTKNIIIRTILLAVLSFIVGIILKAIFKG